LFTKRFVSLPLLYKVAGVTVLLSLFQFITPSGIPPSRIWKSEGYKPDMYYQGLLKMVGRGRLRIVRPVIIRGILMRLRCLLSLTFILSLSACSTSSPASPEKASCGYACACASASCACEGCAAHKGGASCSCGHGATNKVMDDSGHSCGHTH
jgi:hypothetical protein